MKSATNPGRVAGILYLLLAVFGPFGLVIMPTMLIVNGDAAATASNILASEGMFQLAIVSGVMVALVEIGLVVVLYQLLRPVNQTLSLIAAFSRLVMAVVQAINLLNYFAVLLLLSGADYLNVFEPDQINASVLLFLNLHSVAANLWQIFFGLHLLILANLLRTASAHTGISYLQIRLYSADSRHPASDRSFRLPYQFVRECCLSGLSRNFHADYPRVHCHSRTRTDGLAASQRCATL